MVDCNTRVTILHLSDVHRTQDELVSNQNILAALTADLRRQQEQEGLPKPDLLVISGDLTQSAKENEYNHAYDLIDALKNELTVQAFSRVILVPGNHDVNWDISGTLFKTGRRAPDSVDAALVYNEGALYFWTDEETYAKRLDPFRALYKRIYGREYGVARKDQFDVWPYPELSVCFVGLNSCDHLDHLRFRGAINEEALYAANRRLMAACPELARCTKIAVWHHDLNWLGRLGQEDCLEPSILGPVVDAGYDLALCGHTHRANFNDYTYSDSRLPVVAAGSLCAGPRQRAESIPRLYNLIQIQGNTAHVHTRSRDTKDDPWRPYAHWGVPPVAHFDVNLSKSVFPSSKTVAPSPTADAAVAPPASIALVRERVAAKSDKIEQLVKDNRANDLSAVRTNTRSQPTFRPVTLPRWAWPVILGMVLFFMICTAIVGRLALGGNSRRPAATITAMATSPRTSTLTNTLVSLGLISTDTPVQPVSFPTAIQLSPATASTDAAAPSLTTTRAVSALVGTGVLTSPSAISSSNVNHVTQVAFWEPSEMAGSMERILWLPTSNQVIVATTLYAFLLDSSTLEQIRKINVPPFPTGIDLSPKGDILAWAPTWEKVALRDIKNGTELDDLANTSQSSGASISPDGKLVATGTGFTIKLWDIASGRELHTIVLQREASPLIFLPDGQSLVVKADAIKLLEIPSGREIRTFTGSSGATCVSLSPDGRMLAAGSYSEGLIKLWDVASGRQIRTMAAYPEYSQVNSVAFSPDGKLLASAAEHDPTFKIWDVATGQELRTFVGHTKEVTTLAFSPDGEMIASGADDGVRVWKIVSDSASAGPPPSRSPAASTPTPMPISKSAISIRNVEQVTQLALWDKDFCCELNWLPGSKTLTLGSGKISFYNAETLRQIRTINVGGGDILFSPNGTMVVSRSSDGMTLWDVASGSEIRTLGGSKSAGSMAISPDGTILVAAIGLTIKVWDIASGRELYTIVMHNETQYLAFLPDGQSLVVKADAIKLLEIPSGREIRTFTGSSGANCISLSPDGRMLAAGSYSEGLIKLWDVASGHQIRTLTAYPSNSKVNSVAFSPDGKLLASAADHDPTFKIWDVVTGRELRTFVGHANEVSILAFSPDGAMLASMAEDGVRLWGVK